MEENMRLMRKILICGVICSLRATTAFAWGPSIHRDLADRYYDDSMIAAFAVEFGTDVDAVTAGAGDLDFAGDPDHAKYHGGQWTMVIAREYVYRPANPTDWFDIDETKRLKYMMHNLGDVAVPIGHSPANQYPGAEPNQIKEAVLEGLADLGFYGNPSLYSGTWYTGTVSQCIDQYYDEHMDNVAYFIGGGDNETTAHKAWALSQKLARVILADYYLAKHQAAEGAAKDITVAPSETATFSAADLRDPDNIVWASNGTYSDDPNDSGITRVRWDIDGDDVYETDTLEAARTYAQLAALIGTNSTVTYGLEVTDDEGNVTHATGTLTTIPEPTTLLLLAFTAPFFRRRRTSRCGRRTEAGFASLSTPWFFLLTKAP